MHFAARGGHIVIIGLLLQYGADHLAQCKKKENPFGIAVDRGNDQMVNLMQQHAKKSVKRPNREADLDTSAKDLLVCFIMDHTTDIPDN